MFAANSSPAVMDVSPQRRPLSQLSPTDNNRLLTPDASPSRKRQKVVHIFDDDIDQEADSDSLLPLRKFKLPLQPGITSLTRKSITTNLSAFNNRFAPDSNILQSEALSFVSNAEHIDELGSLAPYFQCPSTDCTPYTVAPFHKNHRVVIGTQAGHVVLSKTKGRTKNGPEGAFNNLCSDAILDLDVSNCDQYLVSGDASGRIRVTDLVHRECIFEASEPGTRIKQAKFHEQNPNLIVSGTNNGIIHLFDIRAPKHQNIVQAFSRSFPPIKGVPRNSIGVTSISWLNDMTIAAACESYTCVKTWDLRKSTRNTTMSPVPTNQARNFGIASMAHDKRDNKLFAACKDGHIYSYDPFNLQAGIIDELSAPELKINTFAQRISVLDSTYRMSGSYLAVSGGESKSIFLFAKPKVNKPSNTTSCTAILKHGHGAEVTGICTTRDSGIASISDDGSVRYWYLDDELAEKCKKSPSTGVAWAEKPDDL